MIMAGPQAELAVYMWGLVHMWGLVQRMIMECAWCGWRRTGPLWHGWSIMTGLVFYSEAGPLQQARSPGEGGLWQEDLSRPSPSATPFQPAV